MSGNICAQPQAAVPAVSENHPPVDRLLGGQRADGSRKFARKLARPPLIIRDAQRKIGELPALLILDSGGLEIRTMVILNVERVRLRRALPAPAKEP